MDWSQKNTPLTVALRRRARLEVWVTGAQFVGALAFPLAVFAIGRWLLGVSDTLDGVFTGWFAFCYVGLFVILSWGGLYSARRHRQLATDLATYRGCVCPDCFRGSDPERAVERDATCPHCGATLELAQTRNYWERYARSPSAIMPWSARNAPKLRGWLAIWLGPGANVRRTAISIAAMALWILVASFVVASWPGGSVLLQLFEFAPFLFILACIGGGAYFFKRYRAREGDARHCLACNYQQPPEGVVAERCPECGQYWQLPGGTRIGTPTGKPWMLRAAVGCWLLPMLVLSMQLQGFSWHLRIMPTGALIHEAVADFGFTDEVWAELNRRTLSDAQKRTLAEGLLDNRDPRFGMDGDGVAWFLAEHRAGTLPEGLMERFVRESISFALDVGTGSARVGAPQRVTLRTEYPFFFAPVGINDLVVFGGIRVGDARQRVGRIGKFHHAGLLDQTAYLIHSEFTPTETGEIALSADVWFALIPNNAWSNRTFQWSADGAPAWPTGTIHPVHYRVETTVEVVE